MRASLTLMSTKEAGPHGPASVVFPPQPVDAAKRPPRSAGRGVRRIRTGSISRPAIVFGVIFVVPTLLSFYYSLTRWTLFETEFIGLDNFFQFFREPALDHRRAQHDRLRGRDEWLKVVIGLLLATLLTSQPAVAERPPFDHLLPGPGQHRRGRHHLRGPDASLGRADQPVARGVRDRWPVVADQPEIALLSVAFVDVWKGVGIALVIFIAGILSIPEEYFDAARLEGGAWVRFRHVIVPLSRNATFTVILLSFIGGLRSFDLIWTMTRGGPGFSTDVIASTIYKQYQAGFYGLATAGNVILFIAVTLIVFPMMRFFNRHEIEL